MSQFDAPTTTEHPVTVHPHEDGGMWRRVGTFDKTAGGCIPVESEPILEAMASAWEAGRKAGADHENAMWKYQAGTRERPVRPVNPFEEHQ